MIGAAQNLSVIQQQIRQRRERFGGAIGLIALAVVFGIALVLFTGPLPLAAGLALLSFVLLILLKPRIGVYTLLFCSIFLEQWGIAGLNPITTQIPFYQTLNGSANIPIPVSPLEMLLLLTLVAVVVPYVARRGTPFVWGQLFGPLALFLAFVILSIVYGLAGGSGSGSFDIRAAWEETRSFFYLGLTYLLTCNLIRTKAHLRTFVTLFIVGIGLKSIQGIARYTEVRINGLQVEAITGHEDVVFFAAFVLLFAGLLLFGAKLEPAVRKQLQVMAVILPPLLFTLLVTNRRLGFVVLAVGLTLLAVLLFRTRRSLFLRIVPIVVIGLGIYIPLFWNGTGALSQPIRSVRSIFAPTTERDRSSNAWRELENINIDYNLRTEPITGLGFGRPYSFIVAQPPLDATGFTYWRYIAHNAIYWVWMKMGLVGFILFWNLIGSVIVLGLVMFRRLQDGYLRTLALTVAGVTIMQVIFSYGDLGLTYSRSMIFLGCMLGILTLLPTLEPGTSAQDVTVRRWWLRPGAPKSAPAVEQAQ